MGMLTDVSKFKIQGLPVGAVATGAVIGGVGDAVSGVIKGAAPQAPSWAIKGALAFVVAKFGKKVVGDSAAAIGALFLTYDAAQ